MGDGVLVADENGKMVLLNPAAEALMGPDSVRTPHSQWSETYGIYHPVTGSLYPPSDLPLARAMRGEHADGVELHVCNPRKTGDVFVSVNVRISGQRRRGPRTGRGGGGPGHHREQAFPRAAATRQRRSRARESGEKRVSFSHEP